MIHRWRPCPVRLVVDVCARPGCTAERQPHGEKHAFRATQDAPWSLTINPRCTGRSMAKPRKYSIDKGDEF